MAITKHPSEKGEFPRGVFKKRFSFLEEFNIYSQLENQLLALFSNVWSPNFSERIFVILDDKNAGSVGPNFISLTPK